MRCSNLILINGTQRFTELKRKVEPHHETWTLKTSLKGDQKWCQSLIIFITKTSLYNIDPLKPHFYIVKLGFTGVYIIFLISAQKHRLWYSLEPPRRGGSNEYPQSMFWAEIRKISEFFLPENFQFLEVKFSLYLNRHVFVIEIPAGGGKEVFNILKGILPMYQINKPVINSPIGFLSDSPLLIRTRFCCAQSHIGDPDPNSFYVFNRNANCKDLEHHVCFIRLILSSDSITLTHLRKISTC